VTGISGYALDIIQGYPLVMNAIRRKFFNVTPRQEYEFNKPPEFDFSRTYGLLLMVFLVGIVYSLIAPIIIPFTMIYFFVVYMIMKYEMFYVYETKNESGGSWWPKIFNLSCICIGFSQFVFFCVIVLYTVFQQDSRYGKGQAIMVGLLPIVTFLFWSYCMRVVAPRAKFIVSERDAEVTKTYFWSSDMVPETQPYHPAFTKPLMKLWVPENVKHMATQFYKPRFENTNEYVHRRNVKSENSTLFEGVVTEYQGYSRDGVMSVFRPSIVSNLNEMSLVEEEYEMETRQCNI
jgi:hypothetical protein